MNWFRILASYSDSPTCNGCAGLVLSDQVLGASLAGLSAAAVVLLDSRLVRLLVQTAARSPAASSARRSSFFFATTTARAPSLVICVGGVGLRCVRPAGQAPTSAYERYAPGDLHQGSCEGNKWLSLEVGLVMRRSSRCASELRFPSSEQVHDDSACRKQPVGGVHPG